MIYVCRNMDNDAQKWEQIFLDVILFTLQFTPYVLTQYFYVLL